MRQPKPQTRIKVLAEVIPGTEETEEDGRYKADYVIGEISYTKGGTNYFSGNHHKRGYLMSVMIRTRETGNGYTSESFMMFGAISKGEFIEEAKMFSAKRLQALATDATILGRVLELKADCLALREEKQPAAV